MSVFSTFDLFGTKQEKIDWDKTAKSDFEGSITIETYSNNLTLDPRQSKNTLVCVYMHIERYLNNIIFLYH